MTHAFRYSVPWLVLLVAAPSGCADPGSVLGEHSTVQEIDTFLPHQGRLLLGFNDPDVRLTSFTSSAQPETTVGPRGELVAGSVTGAAFTNVQFDSTAADGSQAYKLRIDQVIAPVAPTDKWQYVLSQSNDGGNTWLPACNVPHQLVPAADPPPVPTPAIAMNGYWAGALYFAYRNHVSFSCVTGVAAKCDGWGFPVERQWPTTTPTGVAISGNGADMMQACTRMARADYCARGMPNTLDGTPIEINSVYDGVPQHDVKDEMQFEAAWRGAAVLPDHAFPSSYPALCLTKLRWSTLPIGGNCPSVLPDPRVTRMAKYCDDLTPEYLESHGAQMYSSSSYMDAGLYTYTDDHTGYWLTTTNLPPENSSTLPKWRIDPAPTGINFPVLGQPVRFEASIFAPKLPVVIPDLNLVKLVSYHCDSDVLTTSSSPEDQSCAPIAVEGWVYPPNSSANAKLRRWTHPVSGHSITTTVSPTEMIPNGWKLAEVVGGVLRAGINVNLRWGAVPGGYTYSVDVQTPVGWISGCFSNAFLGSQTALSYAGACPSLGNLAVNHADIIGFRVNATPPTPGPVLSQAVAYDGFSSDVYVTMPNSTTTVVAVSWNNLGDNIVYSLDVRAGGTLIRCADTNLLANDTSYVHTGRCWSAHMTVPTQAITELQLCAYNRGTSKPTVCGTVKYEGRSRAVIKL